MYVFAKECKNEAELYPNRLLQIWNKCKSYISAIDNNNHVHHHQKQQQHGNNNIKFSQVQIIATEKEKQLYEYKNIITTNTCYIGNKKIFLSIIHVRSCFAIS